MLRKYWRNEGAVVGGPQITHLPTGRRGFPAGLPWACIQEVRGQGLSFRHTGKRRGKAVGRHGSLKEDGFPSPGRNAAKKRPDIALSYPVGLPPCELPRKGWVSPGLPTLGSII